MSAGRERILESVARGEISPEDGNALLKALDRPRPPVWKRFFVPLALLSTRTALLVSVVVAVVSLVLSRLQVHFDGALDTHFGDSPIALHVAVLELLVWWPLTALVFWGASYLLAKQGRFVDFLNAVGLARIPLVAAAVVLVFLADVMPRSPEEALEPGRLAYFVVYGLVVAVPLLAWSIALVTGFREASGLRGIRLALSFVGALLVAEVLSKVVLVVLR